MLDGTTFSVIATDAEGLIEMFNAGAERLLGYAAAEMVGSQTLAAIHLAEEVAARAAELTRDTHQRFLISPILQFFAFPLFRFSPSASSATSC